MTRINAGIPPADLSNKHLIAEHREIKRIPNAISKGRYNMTGQPKDFTLGTGHVKFFYDKCGYLLVRYCLLYRECKKRKFNVTNFIGAWFGIPDEMMNDYKPTTEAIKIVKKRIAEKTASTTEKDDLGIAGGRNFF